MSYGSGDEARHALTADLVKHGHQSGIDTPGVVARGDDFERVIGGLDRLFDDLAEPHENVVTFSFPPLMPEWVFRGTDYLASFPQLTGSINVFTGGDKEHRKLLQIYEEGDWAQHLEPSGLFMVPATCHNIYPRYQNQTLPGPVRVEARGWCFRHEPDIDPMRMVSFRIYEQVFLGDADGAQKHRDKVLEQFVDIAKKVSLPVSVDVANDPFFGRAGRIMATGQREEALKFEVLVDVYDDRQTAVASGNAHRTHFGENFNITSADGEVAHSACGGIGMERFAIALLATHGMDIRSWPTDVKSVLGL